MSSTILVTGGAGYIGSHAVVELVASGYKVLVLDNLINSDARVFDRLHELCGHPIEFVKADVRNAQALDALFRSHDVQGVIHFAGLKAVGESVSQPLRYVDHNVNGTLGLLQAMDRAGVRRLVFSSSATVYGDPLQVPIAETARLQVTNPYGRTKLMCEDILRDMQRADARWQVAILRYFNPIGAHPSGRIGEHPRGVPNNLMPYITQVAMGQREYLNVFGDDYPTPDGTGLRDYIHVVDLAKGHLAALDYLQRHGGLLTVNLGTGQGVSVMELVKTFSRVTGVPVPYRIVARRPGDVAACYADPALAAMKLKWSALHGVEQMCLDAWRWQCSNPAGYTS